MGGSYTIFYNHTHRPSTLVPCAVLSSANLEADRSSLDWYGSGALSRGGAEQAMASRAAFGLSSLRRITWKDFSDLASENFVCARCQVVVKIGEETETCSVRNLE
jgi:hypothetical protein